MYKKVLKPKKSRKRYYSLRDSCYVEGSPDNLYFERLLHQQRTGDLLGKPPKEAKPGDILIIFFKQVRDYKSKDYKGEELVVAYEHDGKVYVPRNKNSRYPGDTGHHVSMLRDDIVRVLDPELTRILRPICPDLPHILPDANIPLTNL